MTTLRTWQNPDWDITTQKRDPSKGPLRWKYSWAELQQLYKPLEEKVGTLDFVWCFTEYEHWLKPDISRLWKLDVPDSKIFKFLDTGIWEEMRSSVADGKQYDDNLWKQLILKDDEGLERLYAGNNTNITPLVLVPLCSSIEYGNCKGSTGECVNVKEKDLPTLEPL